METYAVGSYTSASRAISAVAELLVSILSFILLRACILCARVRVFGVCLYVYFIGCTAALVRNKRVKPGVYPAYPEQLIYCRRYNSLSRITGYIPRF